MGGVEFECERGHRFLDAADPPLAAQSLSAPCAERSCGAAARMTRLFVATPSRPFVVVAAPRVHVPAEGHVASFTMTPPPVALPPYSFVVIALPLALLLLR
jgi:hypothetical protein